MYFIKYFARGGYILPPQFRVLCPCKFADPLVRTGNNAGQNLPAEMETYDQATPDHRFET